MSHRRDDSKPLPSDEVTVIDWNKIFLWGISITALGTLAAFIILDRPPQERINA